MNGVKLITLLAVMAACWTAGYLLEPAYHGRISGFVHQALEQPEMAASPPAMEQEPQLASQPANPAPPVTRTPSPVSAGDRNTSRPSIDLATHGGMKTAPASANPDTAATNTNPEPLVSKTPRNNVDRNAVLNPADPADKVLLDVLAWKDYAFDPEVKSAYLKWAKARALRSIAASAYDSMPSDSPGGYQVPTLDELVPKDFLEWVDSEPVVAATIYGIAENADQRLVTLRSLEIDLGEKNIRRNYPQLSLALADKYASQLDPHTLTNDDCLIGLSPRPPYTLEIPEAPMQPVNTRATDRPLDMEDHIINFLEDHPVEIGRKNRLFGDLDVRIAKGMGWWTTDHAHRQDLFSAGPAPRKSLLDDEARPSLLDPVKKDSRTNPTTRPLYAYEVMTSPELQNEFNVYMKSKGFEVSINTGTAITGKTPLVAEVLKASAMFRKAYADKGRLPQENDRPATPREMAAFLIRNDSYHFPRKGNRSWPAFDLESPWPVLDFLVSDRMPLRERQYIWELFRDHGLAQGYGEYLGDGIAQNPPLLAARKLQPYSFAYNTYPMMVKDGGVCGVMSHIGIRLNIALGIPAIHASQPGHSCLVSMAGNQKSGFTLNIEQSAVGGPEETGVSGRGSYIQVRNQFYPLNYGFKQYLEARMIHRLFTILPAGVPLKYRLNLLDRGIDQNPFNFEVAGDLVKTLDDAKALVEFTQDLTKKVHRKIDGITNPDDYLKDVIALVHQRLNEVPVPRSLLDTRYVAQWLGDNRADATWLKYGTAVHGIENFQALIAEQLKSYVAKNGGNLADSSLLAQQIQLVGNSISDTARRADFGKSLHALTLGYDMTRLDPIADPKRLEEKKQVVAMGMDPEKYLVVEPFLPVIYGFGFDVPEAIRDYERRYEASVRGKRSKELSDVMHRQLKLLETHIKDPAWRKSLGTALYQIVGGHEIYAPESLKQSKLAMDPTLETIYALGIDPSQAIKEVTYTYSAALRAPRTAESAIALADYLALIVKRLEDPAARAQLGGELYLLFAGDKKFLVGPGVKSVRAGKSGAEAADDDEPAKGKKKKPLLDPALPIIFELGVNLAQVQKDLAYDYDTYLRERRNTKSSKAFAEYLTLVFKSLPSPDEKKALAASLSHIIRDKEVFIDPESKTSELDATVPILYSVSIDLDQVKSQIETALSKSVGGKRSLESTKGLAQQIQAAGAVFPDKEMRKAWGQKLLTLMQGKEKFTARGNDKEKSKTVADPCQQSIYSHLIMQ